MHASGAHGNESFLVASGLVARNVDGLFCLDCTTGKLTGFVLDPRTHKFTATFQASILDDLPPEQGKKPAYAMTVGRFDTISSVGEQQLGVSLIYVADCNTGQVATFGFPRHQSGKDATDGSATPFFRLDVAEPRKVKLRDDKE